MKLEYLFDIPFYQFDKYAKDKCLSYKQNGEWVSFTTHQICGQINKLAKGLKQKYLNRQNIGIYTAHGLPQWNIVDLPS